MNKHTKECVWDYKKLPNVCEILDRHREPINNKERNRRIEGKTDDELFPYYGATGQVGMIDNYLLDGEYVLLGEDGAPFLEVFRSPAYLVSGKIWVNNHAHVLKAKKSNKFLLYYLSQIDYRDYVSGTTRLKLTQTSMKNIEVPDPPIPTQNRIVEKIEELFSDLDHGVENLKKAQRQLKIYRQAVLKDAFEGKLTKDWREQQDDLPTPEELLQQIKAERTAHRQRELAEWEKKVEQWEKEGENGKKPTKPRESRSVNELTGKELSDLHDIPKGWLWGKINDITLRVEYGTSNKSLIDGEVPVLRMGNMQNGKIDWSDLKYSNNAKDNEEYLLQEEDVLFNRTNSPELVGKAVIYQGEKPAIFAGYLIRLNHIREVMNGYYLNYFLNSMTAKNHGNKVKTDGVNQSNINGTKLVNYPIPLCSKREQDQIVQKIESRLSVIDQLEKIIKENLQKAEALRQSILKKAFSGELVNEETAKIHELQKTPQIYYENTPTDLHAGIMCKIIDAHYQNQKYLKKLNHVKCEKIIHMLESHEGIELERNPLKDAAGPDDFPKLKKIEHRAKFKNWFGIDHSLGGKYGYGYKPKESMQYAIDELEKTPNLPTHSIDKMIELFLPMDKERAEVVATVYAAWNNFLIEGYQPSDKEIVKAAREDWSKQKLKIKRQNFFKALKWMRTKDLIPAGKGKKVLKRKK